MKLVIDSNVFFSAYTGRGLCSDLVDWCLDHHSVFISEEILREVGSNLKKRSRVPEAEIQEALAALLLQGTSLEPQTVEVGAVRDHDDLHVLGLALAAQADMVVTGDQDLLVLVKFKGVPILSPRDAWLKLRA